jgi:V8-like Glu-specific endopeptidase
MQPIGSIPTKGLDADNDLHRSSFLAMNAPAMRFSVLMVLLFGGATLQAQSEALVVHDRSTGAVDTLDSSPYDTTLTFANSSWSTGMLGNTVTLDLLPPVNNVFIGSQFTHLHPAHDSFDLTAYPMRTGVAIIHHYDDTASTYCSGMLVGRRHVIAAGHCVFGLGQWLADSIRVVPAFDHGSEQTFGGSMVAREYIPLAYYHGNARFDMSLLELSEPLGEEVGWVGMAFNTDDSYFQDRVFHKFSYPAIPDPNDESAVYNGDTMYYNHGLVSLLSLGDIGVQSPEAFAIPGQSGSSLLYTDNATEYHSVGVATFSSSYRHLRFPPSAFHAFLQVITNDAMAVPSDPAGVDVMQVFPLPFTDHMNITLRNDRNEAHTITLCDMQGRVVHTERTSAEQLTMERGELRGGAYVLQVRSGGRVLANRVVLVQ